MRRPAREAEQIAEMGIETLARIPFTPEIGYGAAAGKPAAGDADSALYPVFEALAIDCRDQLVAQQRAMLT